MQDEHQRSAKAQPFKSVTGVVDLREYLHRAARQAGHTVSVAGNGLEALDYIDAGFLPDVIILDLDLPVLSGQEALTELAAAPHTRSIR